MMALVPAEGSVVAREGGSGMRLVLELVLLGFVELFLAGARVLPVPVLLGKG